MLQCEICLTPVCAMQLRRASESLSRPHRTKTIAKLKNYSLSALTGRVVRLKKAGTLSAKPPAGAEVALSARGFAALAGREGAACARGSPSGWLGASLLPFLRGASSRGWSARDSWWRLGRLSDRSRSRGGRASCCGARSLRGAGEAEASSASTCLRSGRAARGRSFWRAPSAETA
jgi:hypothetical protein